MATPQASVTTTSNSTLKRELSSSAPELQSVCRKQNSFMANGTSTRMMVVAVVADNGLDNSWQGGCTDVMLEEEEEVEEDMNCITTTTTAGNTMETDDSSCMNQQQKQEPELEGRQQISGRINSMEYKNSNLTAGSTAVITATATDPATTVTNVNIARKSKTARYKTVEHNDNDNNDYHNRGIEMNPSRTPTIHLTTTTTAKGLLRRQTRSINSMLAIKMRALFLIIINLQLLAIWLCPLPVVQAGFWTFYFPNFLKPSGYSELTGMIHKVEADMNETMDAFADIKYFWGQMEEMDTVDESSLYPEESACADVFPLFRKLAIEYSHIDYEHFIKPLEGYRNLLTEHRDKWYPEGPKSMYLEGARRHVFQNANFLSRKTILPREWEQNLYESDLETKIFWLTKLANNPDYRSKREQMVNIWKSVKRNLDSSLPCIYLKYSYRQMAEDINQLALDSNLERMRDAEAMVKGAYKRIDKFAKSDDKAKDEIADAIKKAERFNI